MTKPGRRARGATIRRHDPTTKTVGDGPDLNGPLDIEVTDETQCEARYDIVKTMRGQHLRAGTAAGKKRQGDRQHPRRCARSATGRSICTSAACRSSGPTSPPRAGTSSRHRAGPAARAAGCTWAGAQGPTVLGTINVMCAAALAEGETVLVGRGVRAGGGRLRRFAEQDGGAKIRGHGTPEIRIEGVDRLVGVGHRIIPDRIEAGTFIMAAAITNGELDLHHCNMDHLIAVVDRLEEVGVRFEPIDTGVRVSSSRRLTPDRDGDPAVPRVPHRFAGPADGPALPGRRHQRRHRADLPRPVPARGRAEPHGGPHPQGGPDRHHPGREGTAGRERDGQRPARLGRAGHGRAGRQGDDARSTASTTSTAGTRRSSRSWPPSAPTSSGSATAASWRRESVEPGKYKPL